MNYPIKYEYKYFQPLSMHDSSGLFQKPFAHQINGELRLAHVMNTQTIFGILLYELVQHLLLFGRSGSGKTNIIRIIQAELFRLKIPFLAFDLAKYNTRYIKKYIHNLHILRWDKELFFNPLKPPPGVKSLEWMLTFCEITSEVFGLLAASKSLLIDAVNYLYSANNVDSTKVFPTIHDLNRVLDARRKNVKSRVDIDYIDRIRNKTKAICITFNKLLDVEQGTPIEDIIRHNVCIELVGVNSSQIQTWIVTLIMAWIAAYRTAENVHGDLVHLIFYDEASHAFSKDKTGNSETFLVRQLRTLRESGEAIILADQSISSLIDVIKSNVYTQICLSQSSPKDIKEASQSLGLNKDQEDVINKLEQGQGIIKLASRFPYPILVKFPFIEPDYISEKELDIINENDEFLKRLKNNIRSSYKPETKTKCDTNPTKINDNIKNFLMAVNLYQYKKSLTEITKLANFSAGTGSRIAKNCEKKDLIKIIQITSIRGRPKYPVLKKEAYKALGIKEKKFYGKGAGDEHILFQHLIAEHFKKYKPIIELNKNEKFIDVAIKTNEYFLCIEVALTSVNEKNNIEKNFLKAGGDFVLVVCKNKKVLKEVKNLQIELSESMRNSTSVCLLSEILTSETDEFIEKLLSGFTQ